VSLAQSPRFVHLLSYTTVRAGRGGRRRRWCGAGRGDGALGRGCKPQVVRRMTNRRRNEEDIAGLTILIAIAKYHCRNHAQSPHCTQRHSCQYHHHSMMPASRRRRRHHHHLAFEQQEWQKGSEEQPTMLRPVPAYVSVCKGRWYMWCHVSLYMSCHWCILCHWMRSRVRMIGASDDRSKCFK
jgi:hypothetical protein